MEDQTGATISLTVYYQNEVFTKTNYKEAARIFQKKPRIAVRVTKLYQNECSFKFLKQGTFYVPMNTELSAQKHDPDSSSSQFPSFACLPDICQQSAAQKTPICVKCRSSIPRKTVNGFVGWIRCNDPLCQYLVHAACIGFHVASRESLKMLPPFSCEAHRD